MTETVKKPRKKKTHSEPELPQPDQDEPLIFGAATQLRWVKLNSLSFRPRYQYEDVVPEQALRLSAQLKRDEEGYLCCVRVTGSPKEGYPVHFNVEYVGLFSGPETLDTPYANNMIAALYSYARVLVHDLSYASNLPGGFLLPMLDLARYAAMLVQGIDS